MLRLSGSTALELANDAGAHNAHFSHSSATATNVPLKRPVDRIASHHPSPWWLKASGRIQEGPVPRLLCESLARDDARIGASLQSSYC
jgi:hypothetical protein